MSIPDNYSQWQAHEREQERWLSKRPKCIHCKERIQDEECYVFEDGVICPACLDKHHRIYTEDFMN